MIGDNTSLPDIIDKFIPAKYFATVLSKENQKIDLSRLKGKLTPIAANLVYGRSNKPFANANYRLLHNRNSFEKGMMQ